MMLLQGNRIFYIEDDLKNRALTMMILEQAGARVGFERWGQKDAIARLTAFLPVDLILLDLMFPRNVTGYDVFDAICREPLLADIPIVAVSASDPEIEIPKTREKGFAGFISKPIDLRLFPKQVASFINGEHIGYAVYS